MRAEAVGGEQARDLPAPSIYPPPPILATSNGNEVAPGIPTVVNAVMPRDTRRAWIIALFREQERENARHRAVEAELRQEIAEIRDRPGPIASLAGVVVIYAKTQPAMGAILAVVLLLALPTMAYSLATGASLAETVAALVSIIPGVINAVFPSSTATP